MFLHGKMGKNIADLAAKLQQLSQSEKSLFVLFCFIFWGVDHA